MEPITYCNVILLCNLCFLVGPKNTSCTIRFLKHLRRPKDLYPKQWPKSFRREVRWAKRKLREEIQDGV